MWGQSAGKRESLDAVQALFTKSQSTGLLSTVLATNPKHRTIWAAMREVNSIPARPSTAIIQNNSSSFAKYSNAIKMFYCLLLLFASLKGH